jgi:hypothetical protein
VGFESFIIDNLGNQGTGNLAGSCCNTNQVLGTNIGGLGANCCPTNNDQVLGATARGRTIEVPEVLGINEGETLVEVCIPVIPPGFSILFSAIEKNIVFDALVAGRGKVFINGRLIKKIPFETCDRSVTPATGNLARITLSNVRAVTVEVIFALCINLPESVPGARVVVLESSVDEVDLPNLRCPNLPCIRGIVEKDCIRVRVKVERDTMITLPATGI